MTKLADILDVSALNEMRKDGYIRQAKHPTLPLVSECYTKQTMFERAWTHETRTCRGLIWDTETQEVIARPFSKFFNWGEPSCPHIERHEWVQVWDKLDGSLGILYDTPGGSAVATKNSFTSPQAIHATEVLRSRYTAYQLTPGVTTLVEIVYPENRIVLDYGDVDDLFYLGSVDVETGLTVNSLSYSLPFPRVELLAMGGFIEMADHFIDLERNNSEGVVMHVPDRDIRVKMKQKDYIELHRVCTGLNKKQLWSWLSEGKGIEEILSDIPEELHDWAFPILQDLCTRFTDLDLLIAESWGLIRLEGWHENRKVLAEIMSSMPKWMSHAIWFLVDGHEERYNQFLWRQVKPSGEKR